MFIIHSKQKQILEDQFRLKTIIGKKFDAQEMRLAILFCIFGLCSAAVLSLSLSQWIPGTMFSKNNLTTHPGHYDCAKINSN